MTNKTHIIDMSGEEMDKRFAERAKWPTVCPSCKAVIEVGLSDLGYAIVRDYYSIHW